MPTGPFKTMWEQLAAWGFKQIDVNGRTDTVPPKPEESADTKSGIAAHKTSKQVSS